MRVRSKMMTTSSFARMRRNEWCASVRGRRMECATNAVMRSDDDDDGERRASSSLCSSSFSSLSSSGEKRKADELRKRNIEKMMTTFMDRIEMNKTLILSYAPTQVTLAPNFDLEGPESVIQALSVLATITSTYTRVVTFSARRKAYT